MKLWLDDVRRAPEGWEWAKTVADAKRFLEIDIVDECSLDHDLGACAACMDGKTDEEWFTLVGQGQAMPHCDHVGTGYDLCLWMAETGHWPPLPPKVHSLNPVGAARMRGVITRYWAPRDGA